MISFCLINCLLDSKLILYGEIDLDHFWGFWKQVVFQLIYICTVKTQKNLSDKSFHNLFIAIKKMTIIMTADLNSLK